MTLKRTLATALILSLAPLASAFAIEEKAFDPAAFKADQAAGKHIVVDVWASWCPVCKAQHAALDKLNADKKFADVVMYKVDFDAQKDVVRQFGATSQSTLIAFHGSKETARMAGKSGEGDMSALLASTGN